ncbi:MAG: N-acetylmuramic acid 6-phosphate etherase [Acidobacteria bacterium]|nr:N-acetylmuramic acid 6-phosphate etherase [Acidobacteriota bacterium]
MRITERQNSTSASLDRKSTHEVLRIIHREDARVPAAVRKVLPQIARAVDLIAGALLRGGRLIYLGAGTSGRLGVLDAAECIPTFGTDRVIGVMAGGREAMFRPSEVSEDDPRQAVRDLRRIHLRARDVLVGISASGRTPYAMGGMRRATQIGASVIALTCNPAAPMRRLADIAIVPVVGPEVIAGSSRMKAGTAQKLVLNMLSTASMVRWGRVLSGLMIHVQLTNRKLRQRGCDILTQVTGCTTSQALRALDESRGKLPVAILLLLHKVSRKQAEQLLRTSPNPAAAIRAALAGGKGERSRTPSR